MFRTKSWQCSQCLSEFWSLSSQFFDKLVAIGVQRFVDWSIRGPNTMGNFENTSWIVLVKNCTKNYLKFAPILISRIRDTRISKVSSGIVAILWSFVWIFWNLREFWFSGSQRFDKILGRKKPRGISCQKCLDEKLESFVEFSTTNEHSWYIFWESFDFRELGQRVRSKFLFCRFLLTRSVPATDLPSNTMAIIPLIKSIDRRIV